MNSRIQDLRRRPADFARDQSQSSLRVDRRFMFGENNQRRAALIKPWIHSRSDLHPTCEREADVHAITHSVRSECALDFLDDFFARGDFPERQSNRGSMQPIKMLVELENASVVQPQPFPNCVSGLHDGIKWADPCFISMHQPPVDVYNQIAILLVKLL